MLRRIDFNKEPSTLQAGFCIQPLVVISQVICISLHWSIKSDTFNG